MKIIKVPTCGSCDNCIEGYGEEHFCEKTDNYIVDMKKINDDCPLQDLKNILTVGYQVFNFIVPPKSIIVEQGNITLIDMDFTGLICFISVKSMHRVDDTLFIEV